MSSNTLELAGVVGLALAFDFTNGFHDTANAVATSVSTRALSPRAAVGLASIANLVGAFASTAVATTIGTGVIKSDASLSLDTLTAALVAALAWNLLTWWLALPSSSSHALIGGLIGASIVASGLDSIDWQSIAWRILLPAAFAPVAGYLVSYALMIGVLWLVRDRRPSAVNRGFRGLQALSSTAVAFAHGANDAQKTMGVIGLALVAAGTTSTFSVPPWAIVGSALMLALGTYAGGWRIMRTLGYRVYRLEAPHGFSAQTGASAVLIASTLGGIPVSTTHVITGSVFGAASTSRLGNVRWGLARDIAAGWAVTLPAAALVGALLMLPSRLL